MRDHEADREFIARLAAIRADLERLGLDHAAAHLSHAIAHAELQMAFGRDEPMEAPAP